MLPLLEMSTGILLKSISQRFPERPAISCMGSIWTYRDLDILSDRIAANLLGAGFCKGERVLLWSDNSPEGSCLFLCTSEDRGDSRFSRA